MKSPFCIVLVLLLLLGSNTIAQKDSENNTSKVKESIREVIKFVATDFTSSLGTAHARPPAQRFVGSRKLNDGSKELFKMVYFPQWRVPVTESFLKVEPLYYETGVEVILRKPSNEEVIHCDSFSNFVKVDASQVKGKKNSEMLRFISLEFNALMMFEFEQMKCFILESVVSDEKNKVD